MCNNVTKDIKCACLKSEFIFKGLETISFEEQGARFKINIYALKPGTGRTAGDAPVKSEEL